MISLHLRKMGIDTYKENIAYLPHHSEIAKSQGFKALSKIELHYKNHSILATLNMTENGLVGPQEVGLSNIAFERLGASEGEAVQISHPNPLHSTDYIRQKLDGHAFTQDQLLTIVQDILFYRYSNIELTAFVIACSHQKLNVDEIAALTESMIETGECIHWDKPMVLDKHSIGGVPGNRTTMIIVPIIAALGLTIPKTSSRAITSPAGTADTMGALTEVQLSLDQMKKIVSEENACIAWGGSLSLAPVDDIIISVERALNLDSEGQMIASILSKKKAAGSTHVVLDIPIGSHTKVRSHKEGERLKKLFENIGKKIGLHMKVVFTDGNQPIGRGIGPVLELGDVLQVLQNHPQAPQDLKEKSIFLAGELLELARKAKNGKGAAMAREALESGAAHDKFLRIAEKQGPLKSLHRGRHSQDYLSPRAGSLCFIHNRKIARVAKLAGAPQDLGAGVYLHKKVGDRVAASEKLFTIYAETREELKFAVDYAESNADIINITDSH